MDTGVLTQVARHNPAELLTGAVVLLIAGGFLVFAIGNTGRGLGGGGYSLNAQFNRVDGLSPGADVRIAGVKVGSVGTIRLDPKTFQATVGFSVEKDIELSTDSSASVASDGLLGGKYLSLAAGGDDQMLKPGGMITITQDSMNLESLIGKYLFGSTGGKGQTSGSGDPSKTPSGQSGGTGLK